ncbi:MAG: hypothetical protein A3F67_09000 [Verrucomicrobia bacterium RIFCSPHIGHO2_12_FULL_41_10]|nr:MAG: hypothetical protein A3F67_09000 [Verrucomicrobia bacterium RIFCSPHIGHO2_12_FULL_41_10]HLB33078.1 hypothetical protein [Chthoniobacterales bacterium]
MGFIGKSGSDSTITTQTSRPSTETVVRGTQTAGSSSHPMPKAEVTVTQPQLSKRQEAKVSVLKESPVLLKRNIFENRHEGQSFISKVHAMKTSRPNLTPSPGRTAPAASASAL